MMTKVLMGATVIDGIGNVIPDAVVVIEGERISALGPRARVTVPPGATQFDLRGRWVIPGLIDCHVHVYASGRADPTAEYRRPVPLLAIDAATNAYRCLVAGFTSLRDAGAPHLVDIGCKRAINEGLVAGPRMQVCGGFLSITGGHGDPLAGWPPEVAITGFSVVDGVDEARKEARLQLRHGVDALKVGATGGVLSEGDLPTSRGLTREEIAAVVEEGLNVGKKTLAHAQGAVGIENAIVAGVASIEHGCFVDARLAAMMIDRGVFLVPTLTAVHHIIDRGIEGGIPAYAVDKARRMQEIHRQNFVAAYRAGVRIAMGTDAGTPFNFHGDNARELALMVEAGMSTRDALFAATSWAADLMGWQQEVGSLQAGKYADLVVLTRDPEQDIRVLHRRDAIELVMKGGAVVGNMHPPR